MGIFDKSAASALNRLLRREEWARRKLAPFSGEVVELRFAPLPVLKLVIADDGTCLAAAVDAPTTLTVTGQPEVFAALAKGEEHLLRAVNISGNARLASEILALMRYLRWDIEEDLSGVFGDVIAHRLVRTARDFTAWQVDAGRRLAENFVEYAVEERRLVVARAEFDTFAGEVAKLRDGLARLEQRIERQAPGPDR